MVVRLPFSLAPRARAAATYLQQRVELHRGGGKGKLSKAGSAEPEKQQRHPEMFPGDKANKTKENSSPRELFFFLDAQEGAACGKTRQERQSAKENKTIYTSDIP